MNRKSNYWGTGRIGKSILLFAPMMMLIMLMLLGSASGGDAATQIARLITIAFFGAMFFLIIYTGKTDKWRAVAFIVSALLFCIAFIHNLILERGSMTFSNAEELSCTIPFCHIVTTMMIIPAAVKQTILFPGSLVEGFASISAMFVIVLCFSIVLGRGFCSWGCFYGGWDDGTSRILRKPVIKKVNNSYKWFSFAMLIVMALWSAEAAEPTYCSWLCPFKAVTENERIIDTITLIKNIIFTLTFAVLVVVLPLLTKKRIQCATFCPMGALLSLFNKINIFEVKNDTSKCIGCGKCEKACPMLAIEKRCPTLTCSKCGKCVDACPTGAMRFHIKCTPIDKHTTIARTLFIFPAYTFLVTLCGGSVANGLALIINLFI